MCNDKVDAMIRLPLIHLLNKLQYQEISMDITENAVKILNYSQMQLSYVTKRNKHNPKWHIT